MKTIYSSIALGLILASAGFSQDVKTDFDKTVSWERYHSFAWRDGKRAPNGVVDNSLVSNRVHKAFTAELAKKGWDANAEHPDVYLTYRIEARDRHDTIHAGGFGPAWGRGYYRGGYYGGNTYTVNYVAGSLIVDMIDSRTGELIWRSYATDRADRLPDLVSDKKIGKIAGKAIKNLPRHSA